MLQYAEHRFHGGIHPPENKTQSLQLPLGRPPLAEKLILPLEQHIGQASQLLVNVGDKVLKGQPLAESNGFVSSYLHAPTSGTIMEIRQHAIPHPSGLSANCVILAPDQQDTWGTRTPLENWQSLPTEKVIEHIASMGIVGMGGAGFPTQVKLSGGNKNTINELIINAAECEPYITADDTLMREKSTELIQGIQVLKHLIQADVAIIGIEDNKATAIQQLQQTIKALGADIQLVVVPTKYPSGGEKQLIKLLTGKEVPSGKHPVDIGIVCQNVGTCVAIYDAVYQGQPLISRITTLTGDAIAQPQNIEVPLGTPIAHLMQYAELNQNQLERLVIGGPMMGFTITDTSIPVIKTTNCVLAASSQELPTPQPEQACIRCGMCEQACPASLLPQQLLWFSKSQEHDKAEHYNLFDCIECGACSYVCPSSIPLVQYYRHSKSTIREAREAAIKADHAKLRFEARQARIEAEAAEKEAKRQAARAKVNASTSSTSKQNATAKPSTTSESTPVTGAVSADQAALKKLKVDLAIANTKLKKAQKNLLAAQESGDLETSNTLQIQVNELEKTVQTLQQEMDNKAAEQPQSAEAPTKSADSKPAVSDEYKKAKVALAIATTTLKKVQKQLAEEPDNTELQAKEKSQQEAVSKAETALSALAQQTPASQQASTNQQATINSGNADELKQAKVAFAIATTHLKKLKEKLEADPENAELQEKLPVRESKLAEAKAELERLQSQVSSTGNTGHSSEAKQTPAAVQNDALKKAKIDLAIANAANKKLEKAIKKAEELALPELAALQSQYQAGIERIDQLTKALDDAMKGEEKGEQESKKEQATAKVADPEKQLKIDYALAKAALNKVKRTIETRQKDGASEAELADEGLLETRQKNEAKLQELEHKLNEAGALTAASKRDTPPVTATTSPTTVNGEKKDKSSKKAPSLPSFEHLTDEERVAEIKKQKIAAALEKAKIQKLERQLETKPEEEQEIRSKIETARQQKNIAEHTLAKLSDTVE